MYWEESSQDCLWAVVGVVGGGPMMRKQDEVWEAISSSMLAGSRVVELVVMDMLVVVLVVW